MSVDCFAFRVAAANFAVLSRAVLAVGVLHLFVFQPTPSLAEAAYAFGQGEFGAWVGGSGRNYATQNEAQVAAMQQCMGRGIVCSIIATFRKTCFAIAVQDLSNGWAVRYGPDIPSASRSALQGCAGMGQSCTVKDTFCDTISEQEIQQAAIDQANRAFQEYQREWNECFAATQTEVDAAAAIASCNQALTFPNAVPADRDRIVRQRALLQDRIQQIHDYDAYYAQQEACADYHEDACTAALRSPLADDDDRALMRANLTLAQRFKDDVAACRSGSASACDAALMSSVARDNDRRFLEQWRAATPLFDRADRHGRVLLAGGSVHFCIHSPVDQDRRCGRRGVGIHSDWRFGPTAAQGPEDDVAGGGQRAWPASGARYAAGASNRAGRQYNCRAGSTEAGHRCAGNRDPGNRDARTCQACGRG